MSTKSIELAGIVRNLPDNSVPDGSMQEIINLRPKDGAWRPVGPKVSSVSVPTDVRFIHKVNDQYTVYIGVVTGFLAYWVYDNDVFHSTVTTTMSIGTDQIVFSALYNSVILSNNTGKDINTLVFDTTTQTYNIIDALPDTLDIRFTISPDPITAFSGIEYFKLTEVPELSYQATLEGFYEKLKAARAEEGGITGYISIIYAFEMFDGSIVKHSKPMYLKVGKCYWYSEGTVPPQLGLQFGYQDVLMNIFASTQEAESFQTKYKDLISTVNIYITRAVNPYIELDPALVIPINATELVSKSLSDIQNEVMDMPDYYLVSKHPLVSEFFTATNTKLAFGDYRDVSTREGLPLNNFSHHTIHGSTLFSYNNRVFMGNVTTSLYKGYRLSSLIAMVAGGVTGTAYEIGFEVDIKTIDGIRTVFSGWKSCNFYKADGITPSFDLVPLFSYPDSRAINCRIFVRVSSIEYEAGYLSLKPLLLLNLSYYYGTWVYRGTITNSHIGSPSAVNNSSYTDANRVQASEQANPFYFPAKNSYRIGLGIILGLSSNAIALSQGQFGQFPVYCFTSDGIWTMNIGDGEVLISTITPVSRLVCNNSKSITPIDGGTVFSTDKGLYVLEGTQLSEISQSAEGNHLSRLSGTLNYEAIANNPNLYQVKEFLCTAKLLTYLTGSSIGWDHIHKELVISNPAYKYSWVFSVDYGRWYKIGQSFSSFVTDYPETYAYGTVATVYTKFILSQDDNTELVPVHMETRPLKLSPAAFKRLNRSILQGYINNNLEFPFSVNLFGSPDKHSWFLLNASNTFGSRSEIIIGRSTFSCKYYILVIGGKVDEDAYFTHFDVDWEDKYTNKLR